MPQIPTLESMLEKLVEVQQKLLEVQPEITDPELKEHVSNVLHDFDTQSAELREHYPKAVEHLAARRAALQQAVADLDSKIAAWEEEISAEEAREAEEARRAAQPAAPAPTPSIPPAVPAPAPISTASSDESVWKDTDQVPWDATGNDATVPSAWDPNASVRDDYAQPTPPPPTKDPSASITGDDLDIGEEAPKNKKSNKSTTRKKPNS